MWNLLLNSSLLDLEGNATIPINVKNAYAKQIRLGKVTETTLNKMNRPGIRPIIAIMIRLEK